MIDFLLIIFSIVCVVGVTVLIDSSITKNKLKRFDKRAELLINSLGGEYKEKEK